MVPCGNSCLPLRVVNLLVQVLLAMKSGQCNFKCQYSPSSNLRSSYFFETAEANMFLVLQNKRFWSFMWGHLTQRIFSILGAWSHWALFIFMDPLGEKVSYLACLKNEKVVRIVTDSIWCLYAHKEVVFEKIVAQLNYIMFLSVIIYSLIYCLELLQEFIVAYVLF